jgi:hypothetical protein
MKSKIYSRKELLERHIEALFILNSQSKLVSINEPWDKTKPAPRLYAGKTIDGNIIYKFSCNVPSETLKKLEYYIKKETADTDGIIKNIQEYLKILESKNYSEEISYYYDNEKDMSIDNCSIIDENNIKKYRLNGFEWLNDEIKYCQPCYGIINDGYIISVCRSVRITKEAHEAGIETSEKHRGNNLAGKVLVKWSKDVKNRGCIPLYSTLKENKASQRVAEKTLLKKIGIGISIK